VASSHSAGRPSPSIRSSCSTIRSEQDVTEDLLVDIRNREPLADLAPRGGRLASRFVELRGQLPELGDPEVDRYTNLLRMVFDHHALMVSSSLDLLTVDWRSGSPPRP
jgi:hypothetical protein